MSFKNLGTLTQNLKLTDTDRIFQQGKAAFRAMFTKHANPFKTERDRSIWEKGYVEAERQWREMLLRWREQDKGVQHA